MEKLFYEDGTNRNRMTPLGLRVSAKIENMLHDILIEYDVSPRHFGALAHAAVEGIISEVILVVSHEMNRDE